VKIFGVELGSILDQELSHGHIVVKGAVMKDGESLFRPPRETHASRNEGTDILLILAAYGVEHGFGVVHVEEIITAC
jgi:mannose-6-phosphate isomerase-like protein (cupin superfamily)